MVRIMFIKSNILKGKVKNLILDHSESAVVNETTILKETMEKMIQFKIGMACVVNEKKNLIGVITDGDLRRKLLKNQKPWSALLNDDVIDHCKKKPLTIKQNDSIEKALNVIIKNKIWDLPVLDNKNKFQGILHLQNILELIMKNNKKIT